MEVARYRCHTPAVSTQEPVDSGTFLRDPAVSLLSEILPFVHFRDEEPKGGGQLQCRTFTHRGNCAGV